MAGILFRPTTANGITADPPMHGDDVAHFGFPKNVWTGLFEQGRIEYHPVFPGKPGFGARRIETEEDVLDVIELMRLNYKRVVARHGVTTKAAAA